MKTPEEIKWGLEMCRKSCFICHEECPYMETPCSQGDEVMKDALAYIQQLEKDNAQKDERILQLVREKETLLAGIKLHGGICMMCKYYSTPEYEMPCVKCCVIYPNDREAENLWEWCGVEEENHEQ